MKIVREYKKASNHKWWKITLYAKYTYKNFKNYTLDCLVFEAYGFSSKKDYSDKSVRIEHYKDHFVCYGTSRDEVISREKDLLREYYNYLLVQIQDNKNWLLEKKKEFKSREELLNSFFDIKELKMFQRKEKLKKIDAL